MDAKKWTWFFFHHTTNENNELIITFLQRLPLDYKLVNKNKLNSRR